MARELAAVVNPRLGLRHTLANWQTIAHGLCEPPRKRKRQMLS
jgi:hypothetical protein